MNVFRFSNEHYAQFHQRLRRDGLHVLMVPAAMSLYITIMDECQRQSSASVLMSTESLRKELGIERKQLTKARQQLAQFKLISNIEVGKGVWQFNVLAESGKPIHDDPLDLGTLTTDEARTYGLNVLGAYEPVLKGGQLFSRCPLHHTMKLRDMPFCFKIKDEDGQGHLGCWHCFSCERSGSIAELEARVKRVDMEQAYKNVKSFITSLREGSTQIVTTPPRVQSPSELIAMQDDAIPI